LGEQAHIIGEKSNAARGKSNLTEKERNSYHNLILLCPNHHKEIDSNVEDWTIEKLYRTKSEHELWVHETLSEREDSIELANQIVVTSIIDSTVELCRLNCWNIWTSFALGPDPEWDVNFIDDIDEYRICALKSVWPEEYSDLRSATLNLSSVLDAASKIYMKYVELIEDRYVARRFYKDRGFNSNYQNDLDAYVSWIDKCYKSTFKVAKAINWFADVVRRDINPMFFADHGKFLIRFEGEIKLLEYSAEQKPKIINKMASV